MFAYMLEFVIALIGILVLLFAFRWMIRSPWFAAKVGETIDTATTDAEAVLSVAEDKADRAVATSYDLADKLARDAQRLAKRRGNVKVKRPGQNQFE